MAENEGIGLGSILLAPLLWPVQLTTWIARNVKEQAERELYDADRVARQLTELELSYELGEVSEEEYAAAEEVLLERMRMIQQRNSDGGVS